MHINGKTSITGDDTHPPEPFPSNELPVGGGYTLTPPNKNGDWKVRAFEFSPSQIIVHQGNEITLDFLGVQGSCHVISVDGYEEEFELNRGDLKCHV